MGEKPTGDVIHHLIDMKVEESQHWLSAFALEVRKKDGNEFIPNTLHHIYAGIMRFLRADSRENTDVFKDKELLRFWMVLDSEMK